MAQPHHPPHNKRDDWDHWANGVDYDLL